MADDKILIDIELDADSAVKGFKQLGAQGRKISKSLTGAFAAVAGAVGAAFVGNKVVEAARAQEDAVNKFNTALKLSGIFSQETSRELQGFASQLQRTTRIGDEATLEVAGLIQSLGQLDKEGLKRATAAAVDLSAALGIDLNAAALLVGKAAAGEVSTFSRYGLVIKKGADNTQTLANALGAIEGKFGGAAAAQVQTFSGILDQLSNNFGDVLEEIGFFITKSPVVITLFKRLSDFLGGTVDQLRGLGDGGDILGEFLLKLVKFGEGVTTFVIAPLELTFNLIETVFNGLKTGLQSFVGTFAGIASGIAGFFAPDSKLAQNLQLFKESADEVFTGFAQDTKASLDDTLDFEASAQLSETLNFLKTDIEGVLMASKRLSTEVPADINNLAKKTAETGKVVKRNFNKTLGNAIVGGIQNFTNALINGENAFEAFGKAILGIIGDMAIQIGQFFIIEGIAVEALNSISGAGAIAAGVALVALGTLLKSFSGGGASAATAGQDAANAGAGQAFDEAGVDEAEEIQEAGTGVTINVEGTVVDPKSTGETIASTLQEFFDQSGGSLVVNT